MNNPQDKTTKMLSVELSESEHQILMSTAKHAGIPGGRLARIVLFPDEHGPIESFPRLALSSIMRRLQSVVREMILSEEAKP